MNLFFLKAILIYDQYNRKSVTNISKKFQYFVLNILSRMKLSWIWIKITFKKFGNSNFFWVKSIIQNWLIFIKLKKKYFRIYRSANFNFTFIFQSSGFELLILRKIILNAFHDYNVRLSVSRRTNLSQLLSRVINCLFIKIYIQIVWIFKIIKIKIFVFLVVSYEYFSEK